MSDHNRGAYTPQSEAPLAFDARRTSGGGGGGRPFPLALIVSALILAVIVVALIVFLMRQPDGSQPPGEAQTIDAMKAAPVEAVPVTAPPPGMTVVTEDNLVAPSFAPGPGQPGARPTAPAAADPVGALTVAPKAPAAPVAAAPKAPPAAPVAQAPATGGAMVQIGAFSSAAAAEKGWNDIASMFPGQMAGRTKRVEAVQANGSTLHRAAIGGFATREQAEALCAAMKARGRDCLVR